LKDLARDNTQLLLNKIWELPTERVEEAIVAKLPAPTFVLPREKPLPKPKPLTKWQKFAQEKRITKTKKSKLAWDEILQVSAKMIFVKITWCVFA
jgi:regulator of ribosome biosynthesis